MRGSWDDSDALDDIFGRPDEARRDPGPKGKQGSKKRPPSRAKSRPPRIARPLFSPPGDWLADAEVNEPGLVLPGIDAQIVETDSVLGVEARVSRYLGESLKFVAAGFLEMLGSIIEREVFNPSIFDSFVAELTSEIRVGIAFRAETLEAPPLNLDDFYVKTAPRVRDFAPSRVHALLSALKSGSDALDGSLRSGARNLTELIEKRNAAYGENYARAKEARRRRVALVRTAAELVGRRKVLAAASAVHGERLSDLQRRRALARERGAGRVGVCGAFGRLIGSLRWRGAPDRGAGVAADAAEIVAYERAIAATWREMSHWAGRLVDGYVSVRTARAMGWCVPESGGALSEVTVQRAPPFSLSAV